MPKKEKARNPIFAGVYNARWMRHFGIKAGNIVLQNKVYVTSDRYHGHILALGA